MKITAIKAQVKRAGRFSVFVDDKYTFSLGESALLESGIRLGQELSREEVEKFKQLSAEDKLYGNVLHFTALRPRSQWEIEQYFKRKQVSPAFVETILNKLSKSGMVNDEAFARSWVGSRRLLKPTSRRRLTAELRAKRVANDTIDKVLGEDETDEREVLRELIDKKRKQIKFRNDKLKLMQYLARQGFSYDDIKTVLNEEC
jgi:regulatory protein